MRGVVSIFMTPPRSFSSPLFQSLLQYHYTSVISLGSDRKEPITFTRVVVLYLSLTSLSFSYIELVAKRGYVRWNKVTLWAALTVPSRGKLKCAGGTA